MTYVSRLDLMALAVGILGIVTLICAALSEMPC